MTSIAHQTAPPGRTMERTTDPAPVPQVLQGLTAVVTGGSAGLGRHLAKGFLAAGARVMCAARGAGDVMDLLADHEDRAAFLSADVRDPDSLQRLMSETAERFGGIDIVVANAGITRNGGVSRLSPQDWREVMNTNVDGVFHTVRAALPHLERSGGSMLTVSSAMASRAVPGASAYAASKAAIEAFTRCCAVEFAPRGIRVNSLSPGILNTGMGEIVGADERLRALYWPRMLAGRAGTAQEAVDAAVFLVSPAASYVNGHVLEVNGGLM
ncbi:SDR family NAD(P)-dependent oxidoreductase [Streptomyces sp. H39-S7]|uniref:SDR family NAD(P)-dependent oxidoreductase n=1 Tax=Streptomyces sp. H39-S7 TaxID=3004357 RepID=UPI0022AFD58B|nr:SDR family oxidoreductase [Streptomyces sp. H39-S7]MCZ4121900.1 SDR family oxidoreductase [Streptomyces sp. H39-S7]